MLKTPVSYFPTMSMEARRNCYKVRQYQRGQYNDTDTSNLEPHLRCPNEGFTEDGAKKRIGYDDENDYLSGLLVS